LFFARNGGGTGVFQDLLFVRPIIQRAQHADGRQSSRAMLQLVDRFGLGDRYGGKLQMKGDRIVVGAWKDAVPHEVVLHEPKLTVEP
jgi:hypothetical protein